jgi:hypothetical protein
MQSGFAVTSLRQTLCVAVQDSGAELELYSRRSIGIDAVEKTWVVTVSGNATLPQDRQMKPTVVRQTIFAI